MRLMSFLCLLILTLSFPGYAWAAQDGVLEFDMTETAVGYICVALFLLAYGLVIFEESLQLHKSKPVVVVAGIIWILVAAIYTHHGMQAEAVAELRHVMLEYSEMAFFLFSAITYVNTLSERNIFDALRSALVARGFSYRALFWLTGGLAFVLSPIADNLTTALVMGSVVLSVGRGNVAFVTLSCINIVVAANAGGAFSPFGDITTLMVWQQGHVNFFEFLDLFIPALVSWLIPAGLMSLAMIKGAPNRAEHIEKVKVKRGGYIILALFLFTIGMTVLLHQQMHLPPFLGMMTGMGLLMLYSHFLSRYETAEWSENPPPSDEFKPAEKPFDIFISIKRMEWDTLIFFYGIILCVGGLAALGYLHHISAYLYGQWGATAANITVGVLSALIDNIPVMFAVLKMEPDMSHGEWLLVTLTAGIGGSLLSIGSAAGVALMGQARGVYTFMSHLKWAWAVALGYAAGVGLHLWLNQVTPH